MSVIPKVQLWKHAAGVLFKETHPSACHIEAVLLGCLSFKELRLETFKLARMLDKKERNDQGHKILLEHGISEV